MTSPRQKKAFSIVGAVILALATETLVASHYWATLAGVERVAVVGVLFAAYVQLWAAYWTVDESEDAPVKITAYLVSYGLAVVMAFNGAMVMVVKRTDRQAATAVKAEMTTTNERIRTISETAGGNWRMARELARAEAEREKARIESETREKEKAAATGEGGSWAEWIKGYTDFYIYFIPFLAAIIGKAALAFMIALPGGAAGYLPFRGRKDDLVVEGADEFPKELRH